MGKWEWLVSSLGVGKQLEKALLPNPPLLVVAKVLDGSIGSRLKLHNPHFRCFVDICKTVQSLQGQILTRHAWFATSPRVRRTLVRPG
jgi:hypothetical protein